MLVAEEAVEIRVLSKPRQEHSRHCAIAEGLAQHGAALHPRAQVCRGTSVKTRPSKLDDYKQYIAERVKAAAPEWIPATVLLRELRALGYTGGYSILKDHLTTLKPVAKPEPLIRFETEPGRQMQVDFATIRRGKDRLSVFIATLGWSRATFVEFVTDERHGDAARLSRASVFLLRRRAARGALRQHADGGDRAGSLRTGAASLQPHLPRLRASSWLRAAAVPALSTPDQGKVERFIRYLRASFYVPLASQLSPEGLKVDRDTANARSAPGYARSPTRACTRPPARSRWCGLSRSASGCNRCRRHGRECSACALEASGADAARLSASTAGLRRTDHRMEAG